MARSKIALAVVCIAAPAAAQEQLWARQIGTPDDDDCRGVAVDDGGNACIVGWTMGSLGGPAAGGGDAFVARFDASGALLWARQLGTPTYDWGSAVALDREGNAYIAGSTRGNVGGPNAGYYDAFLAKYGPEGALLWSRQVGTPAIDYAYAVGVDGAGNAYVGGHTAGSLGGANAGGYDAFVAKFDPSGGLVWTRQLGTAADDYGYALSAEEGGPTRLAGCTLGSLGGPNAGSFDAFVAALDGSGVLLWKQQTGTPANEFAYGVAVDQAGSAHVCGAGARVYGADPDAFAARYDASGAPLWTRRAGTPLDDSAAGVGLDRAGNVLVAGHTLGSLGGPNLGEEDAFLAKYDASGGALWLRQFGTPALDWANGVAVDRTGRAYVGGDTEGSLGGPNAGGSDAFLVVFVGGACYPDCDRSTGPGVLDIFDFLCFQNRLAAGEPWACDCDEQTGPGVCDIFDFLCFQNAFAAGCP